MTREEFLRDILESQMELIINLFKVKNEMYGDGEDAHANFQQMANRWYPQHEPYYGMSRVIEALVDKHNVSLMMNGINDREYIDRQRDRILYSLLAIGLKKEQEGIDKMCS